MKNITRTTCRLCGAGDLREVISVGDQYINDFPPSPKEKGRNGRCPLDVVICDKCSLFQLRHTAPQELLYARHYWYKSGINEMIQRDLKSITEVAAKEVGLKPDDVCLDIGANDGTLLANLKGKAITVGCEPATNLHAELKTKADHVIGDFWTVENYNKLGLKKAKVITAIGMFYDMEDPNQFIRDAAKVLDENGLFIAQLMTLKPMLDNNDLGNICHEHLEYYTYKSLKYLFENNGLEIYKVEENDINGGSYRLYARHFKTGSVDYPETCGEKDLRDFMKRLEHNRDLCVKYINECIAKDKKVYVYGASTKGNVILQYYGLDQTKIIAAADRNETKWGAYTLTDIPIVSEEEARSKADVFLVLPYGFINEFVKREQPWLKKGGEFVVPLPEFRVIKQ
jgi:NDP-4-keto-2,6-dideoxyhexose 3-C-methyltransferase